MAKKEQSSNLFAKLTDIKLLKIKDRERAKEDEAAVEDKEELDPQSQQFLEAASLGNHDVIKTCLKQGVHPDVQNSSGETALHILIEQNHPDLESLLFTVLDAGASPNVITNSKRTPLHYAATVRSSVAMRVLLDHSADADLQDINGETPLFTLAVQKVAIENSVSCAQLLINSEADVNISDDNGLTPLHVASKYRKEDLMKLLMKSGADPSIVDFNGKTPLHHILKVSDESDEEYIRILVPSQGHAMLDIKDKTGDAPLHMAARNQCPSTMVALLEMGADPNLVSGKVPKQMALEILYQDFLVNKNEDHEITNDFSIATSIAEPELVVKSPSPILTAMNYSKIFAHIADSKDNNTTYAMLSDSCEDLTVDLLQTCRNMDDARILLQHRDFLLFKTASQDEHKKFMYATYMQRFLQEIWYGRVFESYKTWRLLLLPTVYILSPIIYPIMLLVYLFLCLLFFVWLPRNRNKVEGCYAWRRPFKSYFNFFSSATKYSPYIKFAGHLTSFLCFIAVVAYKCLLPFDFKYPMPVPAVDFIILLWTAGMITNEVKQYRMSDSFASYITANYLDFIFLTTLTISYTLQFIALFYTIAMNYDISNDEYNSTAQWVIIILMVADIIFALNTLIIFGRLLTYFQVSPFLGPLQLSLFRMAWDVIFVLVLLGIVMFAFAASMTKVYLVGLYTIPPGLNETDLEDRLYPEDEPPLIPETVSSMGATLVSLYWSLYGLLDVEDFESYYDVANVFGKALLGLYLVLAVIVLLNMLIAKISNTYANIQENSRVEWNYARASLIIEYQESQDLPIPFNFIQTIVRAIIALFRRCVCCCRKSKVVEISTDENSKETEESSNGEENVTYLDDNGIPTFDHSSANSDSVVVTNGELKVSGNGSSKTAEKAKEQAEEQRQVNRILAYVKADYLKKQEEAMRYSLKELHNKMSGKITVLEDKMKLLWNEITEWKTNTNTKLCHVHSYFSSTQEILRKYLQKKFADRP
ncbi:short transient receptor potential channel 4-like [Ptychodera flava]|uniref:short transient receptor potential channel 4-like n=1 Tax=Ptychodera flava TaxID=63121 RepID=UPI00396A8002